MQPRVFVGSSSESLDVAYAVQGLLEREAEVTVWEQDVFDLTSSALQDLLGILDRVDFGIFVMTPDDDVVMRGEGARAVRDNVIFELGLFMGRLGPERTFLLRPHGTPDLRLPTDLSGITVAQYAAQRVDGNLKAALGPAYDRIRRCIRLHGANHAKKQELFATIAELRNQGHLESVMRKGRRSVFFGGVALRGTIHREREVLEERIREGTDFRFLLLDPGSPDVAAVAEGFGVRESDLQAAIHISLGGLERLQKIAYREAGSVAVRLVPREPPFSFAIADPGLAEGIMIGGLRGYGLTASRRPEWVLAPHSAWFRPLVDSCDALWRDVSVPHQVPAKAGVVVYDPASREDAKVLLISSRADQASWIFPMGGIDPGEAPADAARRECREETGYDVVIEESLGEVDFGPDLGKHLFFLGRLGSAVGKIEPDRREAWVPLDRVSERLPAAFRSIAESAAVVLNRRRVPLDR